MSIWNPFSKQEVSKLESVVEAPAIGARADGTNPETTGRKGWTWETRLPKDRSLGRRFAHFPERCHTPDPAGRRQCSCRLRGEAVWATNTNGQNVGAPRSRPDGNFVLYTPDKPVWHTDTKGKKDVRWCCRDDCNRGPFYVADGPAWDSKTETEAPPEAPELKTRPEVAPAAVETRHRHPHCCPCPLRGPTPWSPGTPWGHRRALLR